MNHESMISLYHVQNTIERYLSNKGISVISCDQKDEYFSFNLGLNKFIIGYVKYDKDEEFIRIELSSDRRFIDIRQDNIYVDHNFTHILPDQEPVNDMFDELIAAFKVYLYDNKEDDIEQFSKEYREYLNSLTKKKHPLQDSPTFPEERSAENEICSDKNPYLTQKCYNVFDVSKFEVGACYKVLRKGEVPENEYDQYNCILTGACEDSILLTYLNLDDGAMSFLIIEVGEINDYEILKMSVTQ